jgi:DNA replication protein DnaC
MGEVLTLEQVMRESMESFTPERDRERELEHQAREERSKAARAKQDAEWREERRLAVVSRVAAALPPTLAWVAAGGEAESEAVLAVRSWLQSDRRGLLIRGGVGAGKTVSAAIAAREMALSSGRSVSWHRPNDFTSGVLHAYDANAPKLGEALVVIDDIGRETKADFCEALCAFVDDKSSRFVITTNLTKDDFRARYDDRLVDRLNACARAVSVKSPSMRKKDGGF